MRFMKWLAVGLLVWVGGCAAPNVGRDHVLSVSSGLGVVAGTITYRGPYAAFRIHLLNQTTNEKYTIQHGESTSLKLSYAFGGEPPHAVLGSPGSPFAIALPAGRYVVQSWQVASGYAHTYSASSPGLEFSLLSGQALYLGNFHFNATHRFGLTITGAEVELTELGSRDLPLVRATFPSLEGVPFTQTLQLGTKMVDLGGRSQAKWSVPMFVFMPAVR
jgi:hypothetical protein